MSNIENDKNKIPAENSRSENLHQIRSTNIFRIANFELFVKPNKYVMAAGVCAITVCVGYIFYMNHKSRMISTGNTYIALNEDNTQTIRERGSKWD